MSSCLRTALIASLSGPLGLGKSRLETLSMVLVGLIHGRTVNLAHVASQCHGPARYASKDRRLQRFFQHVRLDQAVVAAVIVRMLKLSRPKCLALDRTQWKLGHRDVNILVLALVTRRFRVPLLWSVLDHRGNSSTGQRIALVQRYLALFEPSSIDLLLADREFIGADWMAFLIGKRVPFAIRVKPDLFLALADGSLWAIETLLRTRRARYAIHTRDLFLPDSHLPVRLAAKRIKSGEGLIVLTNTPEPRRALQTYKRRWGVECLFGDAKTRGLNLEDTHLTDPRKIDTLTAVLALAMTWIYKAATFTMGMKAIARKAHGRRQKSWFRTGFDALRNAILHAPQTAATLWTEACPKRLRCP